MQFDFFFLPCLDLRMQRDPFSDVGSSYCLSRSTTSLSLKACNARSPRQRWTYLLAVDAINSNNRDENYRLARLAHPSCEFGYHGCYTDWLMMSGKVQVPRPYDDIEKTSEFQNLKTEVQRRKVSDSAFRDKLTYDFGALNEGVPRPCNATNIELWKEISSKPMIQAKIADINQKREQNHWVDYAKEAIHRVIRAFRLADIPLILGAGSLLGMLQYLPLYDSLLAVIFRT
jgi:hypothetical protein